MKKQIEIEERIYKKRKIEIELPYYYKYEADLEGMEDVEYGKIDKGSWVTINETSRFGNEEGFELNKLNITSLKNMDFSPYIFALENKSSKEEYESAKNKCLEFLNML